MCPVSTAARAHMSFLSRELRGGSDPRIRVISVRRGPVTLGILVHTNTASSFLTMATARGSLVGQVTRVPQQHPRPFCAPGRSGPPRAQASRIMMCKSKCTPMTQEAAARIQSAEAKRGDGGVKKGSFAARAQSAAAKNANCAKGGGGGKCTCKCTCKC